MCVMINSGRREYCEVTVTGVVANTSMCVCVCVRVFVCFVSAHARLRAFVRGLEWVALQQAAKPLHQHLLSSDQLA